MIKRRNSTVAKLLNLSDVRDVSANVDALKACLDISFNLIIEHCMDENVLKKFISICTDGASINIGCNGSSFRGLVKEHSHLIPF